MIQGVLRRMEDVFGNVHVGSKYLSISSVL